jgi:adenosylmethionine-8-amino-7-oxononanoate aminotransferase/acetyl esterase/lipase
VLDPRVRKVLDGMLAAPGPPAHLLPVDQLRANHATEAARLCGEGPAMAEVRDLEIPGPAGPLRLRAYRPEAAGPLPIVVWLHGGGWVMGSVDTYDGAARVLARAAGAVVLSVDYRLAPEHRFPAAVDDSLAAVRWAAEHGGAVGGDPARIAVAGDSAGGNLAAVAARRLRGEVDLRMQGLVYPVIDAGLGTPSYGEFAERFGLTAQGMARFWREYLDGADGADPDASPLRDPDLSGVAPAYVLTASHDVLRDEGEAYAQALERAGVPVERRIWTGTIHGFFRWLAATDVAEPAIEELGAALRRALAQETPSRRVGRGQLGRRRTAPGRYRAGMAVSEHPTTGTTRFWHPFADMGAVSHQELIIERGEGVWVFDADGKRYLDATASLWYANIGHARAEVAEAVAAQMRTLEAYSTFGDFGNRPANELTERLAATAPMPDARIFLTSGGGDSIDAAAKIARRHWVLQGKPERMHLISRTNGYHGTHGYGTSVGGIEANTSNWGPLIPQTSSVQHDSLEALEAEIQRIGPDRVAAFFCEPVIGAGGVYPPADGYIEGVADLCAEHGILFISDSVICGFGRLGTWWGIDRWDVQPDMITFAKGVTSGYLPLGGVVVSDTVAGPFFDGSAGVLRHGATYAGHAACCAAALAVLDIYESEQLIPRGRELEGPLLDGLAPLAAHPAVGEVRGGTGFLAAVGLSEDALAADPAAVAKVAQGAREAGVLVRPLLRGVAVSPPLIAGQEHIDMLAEGIRAGLERIDSAPAKPDVSSGG